MTLIRNRPSPSESAPVTHIVVASTSARFTEAVRDLLTDEHTSVECLASAEAVEALESAPDILILDADTEALVALRFLARLRHRWRTLQILAVNVPGEATAAALLDAGIDDAIDAGSAWPYVVARLNASARRMRTANAQLRRRLGDVVYDRENRRVWCAGREVEFAPRELAVLDALWMRAGDVVRHESLQDYVWSGIDMGERSNRLEVYISYVRRKLQASREVTIETLRGAGYRLVRRAPADVETDAAD